MRFRLWLVSLFLLLAAQMLRCAEYAILGALTFLLRCHRRLAHKLCEVPRLRLPRRTPRPPAVWPVVDRRRVPVGMARLTEVLN